MRKTILLFLIFTYSLIYSQQQSAFFRAKQYYFNYYQHAEVLNKSGYQHDYVIGTFEYIEDLSDTFKLKYVATLKITDKTFGYKGIIGRWIDEGFYFSAKKLGADAFCLKNYVCSDSDATVILDVYFAGDNFLKINREKRIKNKIYLFAEKGITQKDTVQFYINDTLKKLNRNGYLIVDAALKKKYNLALGKDSTTNRVTTFNTIGQSRFFVIPNYSPPHEVIKKNGKKKIVSGSEVLFLRELYGYTNKFYKEGNKIIELSYDRGKFLNDIWNK